MKNKKRSKKLNKYYILVLVLILIVGIISATYAFFQVDTSNDTASTTITANSECFNITFEEISDEELIKLDINYPITDKYALGQTDNQDNVKPVVVKVSNKCTKIQDNLNYKLAITTLAKNPINEQDKGYIPDNKVRYNVDKAMNEETKSTLNGPAYLNSLTLVEDENILSLLNEEITENAINIKEYDTVNTYIIDSDSLASNNTSTYYIRLWIDYYEGDSAAYKDPANHKKGNEYDNSTQGQNFESVISLIADGTTSERPEPPKSTLELLREKDKEVSGVEHLSPLSDQGGMYRYQGTDNVPNWILFGTREKCEKDEEDKCTNLYNMTYDEYIDKYMYRIIGITKEGQLYLLKESVIKEEDGISEFAWNVKYAIEDCTETFCEWPYADLYRRLNGTSNGTSTGSNGDTNLFLGTIKRPSPYDYLTEGTEWYNLIDGEHYWMYGDLTEEIYRGSDIYAIETGNTATTRWWLADGQTTCSDETPCTEREYTWTKSEPAKIGLMYMHDVIYAYADCSSGECGSRGHPNYITNVKDSWIHFQKDGYNASLTYEWLISRFGLGVENSHSIYAWSVENDGDLHAGHLYKTFSIRPVFYLKNNAKITSGDGTKDSPFIFS